MFNFFSKAASPIQREVTNEIAWDDWIKTPLALQKISNQVTLKPKVKSRSAQVWRGNIDVNIMLALVILPKSGFSSFESRSAGIAARPAPGVKVVENFIKGAQ